MQGDEVGNEEFDSFEEEQKQRRTMIIIIAAVAVVIVVAIVVYIVKVSGAKSAGAGDASASVSAVVRDNMWGEYDLNNTNASNATDIFSDLETVVREDIHFQVNPKYVNVWRDNNQRGERFLKTAYAFLNSTTDDDRLPEWGLMSFHLTTGEIKNSNALG